MAAPKMSTFAVGSVPTVLGSYTDAGGRTYARHASLGTGGVNATISPNQNCRVATGSSGATVYTLSDAALATCRMACHVKQLGSVGSDFAGVVFRAATSGTTGLAVYVVNGGVVVNENFSGTAASGGEGRSDIDITAGMGWYLVAELKAGNLLDVFVNGVQVIKDFATSVTNATRLPNLVLNAQGAGSDSTGYALRSFNHMALPQSKDFLTGVLDGTIQRGGTWGWNGRSANSPGNYFEVKVTGTRHFILEFDTSAAQAAGYTLADMPVVRIFKDGKAEANAVPFGDGGRFQLAPVAAATGYCRLELYPGLSGVELDPTASHTFYCVFEAEGGGQHSWNETPPPQAVTVHAVLIDSDGTFETPTANDKTLFCAGDSTFLGANSRAAGVPETSNSATDAPPWRLMQLWEADKGVKVGLSTATHGGQGYDQVGNAGTDIPKYRLCCTLLDAGDNIPTSPQPDVYICSHGRNGSFTAQHVTDTYTAIRGMWSDTTLFWTTGAEPAQCSPATVATAITAAQASDANLQFWQNATDFRTGHSNDGIHLDTTGNSLWAQDIYDQGDALNVWAGGSPTPTLELATIQSDGRSVLTVWSSAASPLLPASDPFRFVLVMGDGRSISPVSVVRTASVRYTLYLPEVLDNRQTGTLYYYPGNVTDSDANPAALQSIALTNSSTVVGSATLGPDNVTRIARRIADSIAEAFSPSLKRYKR